MNKKDTKWYEQFNDEDFTSYIESGEATCVHIVRDNTNNVNTTDKWIDVISHTNGFEHIVVELFPRITHPKYKMHEKVTKDTNHNYYTCSVCQWNRYICWNAAHNDIAVHREKGHHGRKYAVQCKRVQIKDEKGEICYDYKVTGVKKIK